MTLDELRARFPLLGFAVYAMEPDGDVTFEVYDPEGNVFTFSGPTEAAAILVAFPEPISSPPAPEKTPSIFD